MRSIEPQGSFYLIIVDGYGPLSDGTAEESEFLSNLQDANLAVVGDAVANYSFTYSSLSNMLSLGHEFRSDVGRSVEIFGSMQGKNQMRSVFEQAGWKYVHVESDWTGTRCGPSVETCLENGWVDDFVWEVAECVVLWTARGKNHSEPPRLAGFAEPRNSQSR